MSREDSFIASLFSDNPLSTSGSLASLTAADPCSSIAVKTEDFDDGNVQAWADGLLGNDNYKSLCAIPDFD